MNKTDVSLIIDRESTVNAILSKAQELFLDTANNRRLRTVNWVTVDPAGFDPDKSIEDYYEAPDYAMLQINGNLWEVHGVKESHDFMKKVILPFSAWAITASAQMNSKARYQNSLKHQKKNVSSKFINRVVYVHHVIIMPQNFYTDASPIMTFATETAPASATSYFSG